MAEATPQEWRKGKLGASWQFGFFHLLIHMGGRHLAHAMADLFALGFVLLRPWVRACCQPYLRRRFPVRTRWGRWVDTSRMIRAFARAMVDGAVLGLVGRQAFEARAEEGQPLAQLQKEGKGLILVTAHVGAWQAGMMHLEALGCPVAVVNRRDDGVVAHHLARASEGPSPLRVIDPGGYLGGIPEMTQTLLQGEVLCIMGDRALGASLEVPFLGAPVRLPYSPYKLASVTGAPLAVIFPYTDARGRQDICLAKVMRIPPNLGRKPEAFAPYARDFASALEDFLAVHPYHFFNFYDLWQTSPTS